MKKVLTMMAMFSVVAMMAACGGGNKEEGNAEVDLKAYETKAQDLAKKACECNLDSACLAQIQAECEEAFKDLDDANKAKMNELFEQTYNECKAVAVEEEVIPEEQAEPAKATKTKKATKTEKKPNEKSAEPAGETKTITVTKVGGEEVNLKKPAPDKKNLNKVGTIDVNGARK